MTDFDKHLQEWHKSLESEFTATRADDSHTIAQLLRQRILAHVLELADNVIQMAKYSESDSVRLNATKYAITLALPTITTESPEDSLDTLIKALTTQ